MAQSYDVSCQSPDCRSVRESETSLIAKQPAHVQTTCGHLLEHHGAYQVHMPMVEKNSDAGLGKYHWVNCAVDIVFLMFRAKMMSTQNSKISLPSKSVLSVLLSLNAVAFLRNK